MARSFFAFLSSFLAFCFSFFGSTCAAFTAPTPVGLVGATIDPVAPAAMVADPAASSVVALRAGRVSPQLTNETAAVTGHPIGPGGRLQVSGMVIAVGL